MVGQCRKTVTKPSRSDEVLDEDQQLHITNQIRAHFDSVAPKRPPKPCRSESDATPEAPALSDNVDDHKIPELDRLRSLQTQAAVVFSGEAAEVVQDEFVETQYYEELDSIDKQHHTTGSGFIKVVKEETENGYGIQLPSSHGEAAGILISGYRGNPATNDWTPAPAGNQGFVSSKPNRSEGS